MTTITKDQALAVSDLKAGYTLGHADVSIMKELARIALAALEATASDNSIHDLFLRAKALMYQSGGSPIENSLNPVDAWLFEAELCNSAGATEKCRSCENAQEVPEEVELAIINAVSSGLRDHDMPQRIWDICRAAMLKSSGE